MRRVLYLLPAVLLGVLLYRFAEPLLRGDDPSRIASVLIGKKVPSFALPGLDGAAGPNSEGLKGQPTLINFFASWCTPCRAEHPVLQALAATKRVPIYGINYKDKGDAALSWIGALGNPYTRIGADDGRVGIDWGVYGVPETFIVDRAGRIRYKHVGPLTQADLDRTILPLVARLEK